MLTQHLTRRLLGTVATLLVVSLVTFVALATTPGDAASAMVGDSASAEQLRTLRRELGLDQSLAARYGAFMSALLLRGDLGQSLVSNRAVTELIGERLPYTFVLALAAIGLAIVVGVFLGTAAALRAGSALDTLLMGGAAIGLAIPTFWSALLLIMLFSLTLHWLPVVGADSWRHLVMPAVTLALPTAAILARLVRAGLLDVFGADHVRTAHAKGLAPRRVLVSHVFRNCLIPLVTVMGMHLGHLLGGAFVVETIFGWPGLGRLAVQAIFDRDYPVVMGATLAMAVIFVVLNLAVDGVQGWLDPRTANDML